MLKTQLISGMVITLLTFSFSLGGQASSIVPSHHQAASARLGDETPNRRLAIRANRRVSCVHESVCSDPGPWCIHGFSRDVRQ